ncbi:hypothetical protein VE25_12320 [Devosia geojensis]|uniref:Major facilitator superfamily (MFS) profile domain-containing protein n=1 Tax=Devosia geojensis TaxID=443610 RepID=A0A0F5FSC0_9HYPH|nr:MFS transporter [Devosia geojensis]KKB11485.1 hypothetical protein VE25_12320 [Devosia geojensis]
MSFSPQTRIALVFFAQAIIAGALITRIPDIQAALAINEEVLGLALLGQPVGNLVTIFIASAVLEQQGTRRILVTGLPVLAVCTALAAVAPGPAALFVVLAVYGSAFALTNLAMNIEVDQQEALDGRRFMNRCHGIGSAGLLVTSLVGAALRGAGVPASVHLLVMAPLAAAAALALVLPLKPAPPRPQAGVARRGSVALPTAMTFLLVGFGISAFLLEGAARSWSIIYMRDSFVSPDWLDSLSLTVFIAFMAGGRLVADRFTERFGPPMVARALMAIAALGLTLVALAPTPLLALSGFALTGLGTSAIYPLTLSSAARLPDRPSSENVAAVTMVGSIAVLAAPAILGSVATHWGIRATFAVLIPATVLSFALAWVLRARKEGNEGPR